MDVKQLLAYAAGAALIGGSVVAATGALAGPSTVQVDPVAVEQVTAQEYVRLESPVDEPRPDVAAVVSAEADGLYGDVDERLHEYEDEYDYEDEDEDETLEHGGHDDDD